MKEDGAVISHMKNTKNLRNEGGGETDLWTTRIAGGNIRALMFSTIDDTLLHFLIWTLRVES